MICARCGVERGESFGWTKSSNGTRYRRKSCYVCLNRRSGVPPKTRQGEPEADFDIDVELPPDTVVERMIREKAERSDSAKLKQENQALLHVVERQQNIINTLNKFSGLSPNILVYSKPKHERADAIALAIASDWHLEEEVVKDDIHGFNEYNLGVARQRAERFFQNALRLTDIYARESTITTINLNILGDIISNWIHEELIANTLLAPADALNFALGVLSSGIDFLLRESSYIITGDLVPGNHGRMTKKMHIGDPTGTSGETFLYHALVARYAQQPRVQLRVAAKPIVYETLFESFVVRKLHGYEVQYGGGVGGLSIPLNKKIMGWDKMIRASLTILGHFHQLLPGERFLTNGSLIGYNLFAQSIGAPFEEARQAFALVHARGGGCLASVNPIWVT